MTQGGESDLPHYDGNASIDGMAVITIRQLDETVKRSLKVRAAHHGRSMEEEAREILRSALENSPSQRSNLAGAIRGRFAAFGGVDLDAMRRDAIRQAPEFGREGRRRR